MRERLSQILAPYRRQKGSLISVLQKVQEKLGYLSEESVSEIAQSLRISKNEVYGVASFYAQFRFEKPAEHTIKVCQGTACYVQGGKRILEAAEDELNLASSQTTTDDYKFSLERVACFGSCALAPVVVVDKKVYGRMTPAKTRKILSEF